MARRSSRTRCDLMIHFRRWQRPGRRPGPLPIALNRPTPPPSARRPVRIAALAAVAAALSPFPAHAQPRMSSEPIPYTLRFPAPEAHYVEVEASVPAGQPAIELMMAVWTPGSYLVREYERHVEHVAAKGPDGAPLAVTKTQKNRWRVEAKGAPRVT